MAVVSCIVLLSCLLINFNQADPSNPEHGLDLVPNDTQWLANRKPEGLWFGSRLGRRKRDKVDAALVESLQQPQAGPVAILAFNGGKRGNVNFTPRLGRESGEEVKDSWFSEFYNQKSPPFAPRLGKRRMSVYYFDPTDTQDD